jgi:hypothetical protein
MIGTIYGNTYTTPLKTNSRNKYRPDTGNWIKTQTTDTVTNKTPLTKTILPPQSHKQHEHNFHQP